MTLMSQAEFARHIGATRSYITQLKSAGRLVIEGNKVNVEASVQLIADTKDLAKDGVAKRHESDRKAQGAERAPSASGSSGSRFQLAKARREEANAEFAEIELAKLRGTLLLVEEAKSAVYNGDVIIRNRLESLPDTLAPQLAAESDEQKIRSILMDQVEYLLSDLSRTFNGLAKA